MVGIVTELREEADAMAISKGFDEDCAAYAEMCTRAADEIERLRDALRRICQAAPGVSQKAPAWARGIARAALSEPAQ